MVGKKASYLIDNNLYQNLIQFLGLTRLFNMLNNLYWHLSSQNKHFTCNMSHFEATEKHGVNLK